MIKKILVPINWSLVTILIIASFLRLYNLTELPPGLYPDEAMNGNNAVEALEIRDWKVFYPENHGREGLFINIQSWLIGLIGLIGPIGPIGSMPQPWVLRLPSAIFGILAVLGLYLFTKELFRVNSRLDPHFFASKVALLSSFLLATSFWHVNFSRIGFRAIMAPAFLTWSLYLLLKSFNLTSCDDVNIAKNKFWSSQDLKNYGLAVLAGLIYGLGFYSYIAYRATPLLIIFLGYFYILRTSDVPNIRNNRLKTFLIFTVVAAIATAPLGYYFWNNPQDFFGRTAGISVFNSPTPLRDLGFNILKTAGMFNVVGDFNWRHNIAGRPLLFWPVGILFLIGLISPIRTINPISRWLSLIWLIVTALPVVISNEGLPHALRSLLMATPVFVLSAIGGLKIYELLKLKLAQPLLLSTCYLLFSLLVFESYVTYFITWGQNPNVKNAFAYNDYVIAQYLNSSPKELSKYVALNEKVSGAIERDNPISLQSILFLTDTFINEKRKEKNIIYLTEEQLKKESINDGLIIKL